METKICTKCGKQLPITDFNWRNKEKGTRRSECKYCHSAYMKQKYQEKKEIVQEIKSNFSCAKCGDTRGYVLDFHHIEPNEKEATVARLTSNSSNLTKVYDEIKKCIVLCSNCHREFHYLQNKNNNFTIWQFLEEKEEK